jgi:hypothetical protein
MKTQRAEIRGRAAEFMAGRLTVADLDDEEIASGRFRTTTGKLGPAGKAIPTGLVDAMRKELLDRAEGRLRDALLQHGVGLFVALAADTSVDPGVRLRAADRIVERVMGAPEQKIIIKADDPIEALLRDLMKRPGALEPYRPTAEETALLD